MLQILKTYGPNITVNVASFSVFTRSQLDIVVYFVCREDAAGDDSLRVRVRVVQLVVTRGADRQQQRHSEFVLQDGPTQRLPVLHW